MLTATESSPPPTHPMRMGECCWRARRGGRAGRGAHTQCGHRMTNKLDSGTRCRPPSRPKNPFYSLLVCLSKSSVRRRRPRACTARRGPRSASHRRHRRFAGRACAPGKNSESFLRVREPGEMDGSFIGGSCVDVGGGVAGSSGRTGLNWSAASLLMVMDRPSMSASITPPTRALCTEARRPARAARTPPVTKPDAIAFHGSSRCRRYANEQSNDENARPHTAKLPA